MREKTTQSRALSLLLALFLVFGITLPVSADTYGAQGDTSDNQCVLVYMTSPDPSSITYEPDQSTDEYYYNIIRTPFLAGSDLVFKIATGNAPGINNNTTILDNHVNVYSTNDFTKTPVVTFADFTKTSTSNGSFPDKNYPGARGGQTHTLTLADGKLPYGKTYYLVVDNVSASGNNDGGIPHYVGKKVVFEFSIAEKSYNVSSVSLNVEELLFDGIGTTYTLQNEVLPTTATNKNVSYKSSNATVASVSNKGVITAKASGTATITVTTEDGNKTDTCKVEVRNTKNSRVFRDASDNQELANGSCLYKFTSPKVVRDVKTGRFLAVDFTGVPTFSLESTASGGKQSASWNIHLYSDSALTNLVESKNISGYPSFTYTPTGTLLDQGPYYMVVEANSVSSGDCGEIGEQIVVEFPYGVVQPLELTSSLTSLTKDSRTTLTVNNGIAGYKYKFAVHNNDTGNDYVIQDYKTSNSCEWYAGPAGGSKTITAYVQDASGKTVDTLTLDVYVADTALKIDSIDSSIKNLTASSVTTLSAKASGGKAPYEYRFRVKNNDTGVWYTIQDYKASSSCQWRAGPAGGNKTIYVDVKDASNTVVSKQMNVIVADNLKISKISSSKGTTLNRVSSTTLRADVAGGKSPYEYQFRVYNKDTKKWYTMQEYKKNSNSCTWYAGPGAGKKTVYVDVKDASGNTASATLDVTVMDSDLDIVSVTSSIKNLTASSTTTLTATVKGGKTPYKYRFRAYNKDTGVWYTIQDYKNSNTCKWYAGPKAGNKAVYVDVQDAGGNTASYILDVTVTN